MKIVRNTNTLVLVVSICCFVWGIVYKLYLVQLPPAFPKAYEIAEIVYTLTTSIVGSGVFYFVVVYLEQRRVRKILSPLIKQKLINFAIGESNIRVEIAKIVFGAAQEKSLEELTPYFDRIDMLARPSSPHVGTNLAFNTWYELFDYYFSMDDHRLRSLLAHISYLHPEIIVKLNNLNYSIFQRSLDNAREHYFADYPLSGTVGPFLLYMNTLRELAAMSETHV